MGTEKRAPVQGYSAGIPWSLHLKAYDAYCKRWSSQPALIDLEGRNCRGGFSTSELDEFVPGWREEASEIARLRATIARLEAERDAAVAVIREAHHEDRLIIRYRTLNNDDVDALVNALEFYADPDTYHAIGFFADRPCGEFIEDFSVDLNSDYDRPMPGKRARESIDNIATMIANRSPPTPATPDQDGGASGSDEGGAGG